MLHVRPGCHVAQLEVPAGIPGQVGRVQGEVRRQAPARAVLQAVGRRAELLHLQGSGATLLGPDFRRKALHPAGQAKPRQPGQMQRRPGGNSLRPGRRQRAGHADLPCPGQQIHPRLHYAAPARQAQQLPAVGPVMLFRPGHGRPGPCALALQPDLHERQRRLRQRNARQRGGQTAVLCRQGQVAAGDAAHVIPPPSRTGRTPSPPGSGCPPAGASSRGSGWGDSRPPCARSAPPGSDSRPAAGRSGACRRP